MSWLRHDNPLSATITGIVDLVQQRDELPPLSADDRLDGRTCLVTGASSGLGRAAAIALAVRGGHVIIANRSPSEALLQALRTESGGGHIEAVSVDLADLESVRTLCDRLRDTGTSIDVLVLNAGVLPRRAERTPQGFERMFVVHFLANRLLVGRLLDDGIVVPRPSSPGRPHPRIVFVTSNAHQSAPAVDLSRLGEFVDYGVRDSLLHYARSKLLLTTLGCHLSRRLNPNGSVHIGVHSMCPGGVSSNLARDAPPLVKPFLLPFLKLVFRTPQQAVIPLVHLACAGWAEGRTGLYLHMRRHQQPAAWARDPENGSRLWDASTRLLAPFTQ